MPAVVGAAYQVQDLDPEKQLDISVTTSAQCGYTAVQMTLQSDRRYRGRPTRRSVREHEGREHRASQMVKSAKSVSMALTSTFETITCWTGLKPRRVEGQVFAGAMERGRLRRTPSNGLSWTTNNCQENSRVVNRSAETA